MLEQLQAELAHWTQQVRDLRDIITDAHHDYTAALSTVEQIEDRIEALTAELEPVATAA